MHPSIACFGRYLLPQRAELSAQMPSPKTFRLGYRPALDGLRGIAIICVFVYHIQHFLFLGRPMFGRYLSLGGGFLGVDIFFVLSGFLITTLLLEEWQATEKINLRSFYVRRALRLLPALFFFIGSMVVYAGLTLSPEVAKETNRLALFAILYSTNWVFAFHLAPGSDVLGHLWSLAIEEQFYLLWPLALNLLLRLRAARRVTIGIMIASIALVLVHRIGLAQDSTLAVRIYSGSDTRADSLLVGCVVAMLTTWHMLPKSPIVKLILGWSGFLSLLLIATYLVNAFDVLEKTLYTIGFSIFAIANGLILLQILYAPPRAFLILLQHKLLVWLGKVSYSLYLWHFVAITLMLRVSVPNGIRVLLTIPLAFGLAGFSFYCVERPFLRMKKRYAQKETAESHMVLPISQTPIPDLVLR
jgi:peptidoglycan/LPS O-acetylase OafA/YrhL